MRSLRAWIVRFLSFFSLKQHDRELAEELESHLAMHIEDNLRSGMSPGEARRNALIKLGGVDKTFEEYRDRRTLGWLMELRRNFRYACRILWKQKTLSLTVIGLLALACGANFTVFSYYDSLFLKPLALPDAERLVDLAETAPEWNQVITPLDYTDFHEWRKENRSFEEMAVYIVNNHHYYRNGNTDYITVMYHSRGFPSIFKVQPVLGRAFLEDEYNPGGPKVAMLGYGFWQKEFGGSQSVPGETFKLNGDLYTVVGVLPGDADFPRKVDLWIPQQQSPDILSRNYFLSGIGRLKKGITLAQAQEDIHRIHKNMIPVRPVNKITSPRLQFLRDRQFGSSLSPVIIMFQTAAGILLLIVCANIAGMMLARSQSRSREIGIRVALGSSRAGIIRQLMTESLLLSFIGMLLGIPLGNILLKLAILYTGELPPWVKLDTDIRILVFCGLLMGAAAIFFGLVPALQATRVNVRNALHETNVQSSTGYAKRRNLSMLVVIEVALAFVLLISAGLLLRTWQKTQAIDPGFQVDNVLTFWIQLPVPVYKQQADWTQFFEQFLHRCKKIPGVQSVSGAMPPPLMWGPQKHFDFEGSPQRPPEELGPLIPTRIIFPGYFKTMDTPLVSGRFFAEDDGPSKPAVIVNQSFARRFWPNANPIGKRIRYRDDTEAGKWMSVVGLVRDSKEYGPDWETLPTVYYPYNLSPEFVMSFVIRSAINPAGLINPIRSQLDEMDPEVPLFNSQTMTEAIDQYLRGRRMLSVLMMLGAVAGLLIAAVGIYGVMCYSVSRRTQEIGIRMALGATKGQVLRMVVSGGIRLVITGVVLGVAGAFAASRFLQSMLFGVTSLDVPTYLIVSVLLIGVVVTASLLPASRAASIDPMHALRSE